MQGSEVVFPAAGSVQTSICLGRRTSRRRTARMLIVWHVQTLILEPVQHACANWYVVAVASLRAEPKLSEALVVLQLSRTLLELSFDCAVLGRPGSQVFAVLLVEMQLQDPKIAYLCSPPQWSKDVFDFGAWQFHN